MALYDTHWGWVILLAVPAGTGWLIFYAFKHKDAPIDTDAPRGIGGWLFLVGLGMVAAAIELLQWLGREVPEVIEMLNAPVSPLGLRFAGSSRVGMVVLLGALLVYTATLFLRKRASFPRMMIVLLSAYAIGNLIDVIWTQGGLFPPKWYGPMGLTIYIPYLLLSQRVKATSNN